MSSAGDSGDRFNQFKNKGKDVNVSSADRRPSSDTCRGHPSSDVLLSSRSYGGGGQK